MPPRQAPMKSAAFARADRIESREVTKLQLPKKEPKRRTRKCALKTCRNPFEPRSMTHKCCSPSCAEQFIAVEKARQNRKERQEGLAKLKRKADYVREAQTVFNKYRREVCRIAGYGCICCDAPLDWVTPNKVDAGHYLSRGSSPHLKFIENNVWAQRKGCNRPGGTTRQAFRDGMERRIGIEALEELEADREPRHYTIDELKAIKAHYAEKLKALKATQCHA